MTVFLDGPRLPPRGGGKPDALVILLHGFPEHWYVWRRQIPVLIAAGFRVVSATGPVGCAAGTRTAARPGRVLYGPSMRPQP